MSAKQGNGGNKIDALRLCRLSLLCALCLVFGYIESVAVIVPIAGIKLGLANCIALLLVSFDDIKGAFAVNIARILLSALLFGSPVSLIFSLAGGLSSLVVTCLIRKAKFLSLIGISIVSGTVHNIFQLVVAVFAVGVGALYYLPVLLVSGAVCGALTGTVCTLILKKIKTNRKK